MLSTVATSLNNLQFPYLLFQGSCQCLPNVEGALCNRCKPLYWNLAPNNPDGCIRKCLNLVKGGGKGGVGVGGLITDPLLSHVIKITCSNLTRH